jgi:hypothetical protein
VTAVGILYLIHLYILVIYRNIIALLECDAIETGSKSEYCIDAALKLEIWLKFL